MKTAIVHDWIIDIGGAEQCLENIYNIYPSDLYTLVFKKESVLSLGIDLNKINSSFIKKLPWATQKYRNYLPLFPLAIEQFDLSHYDVIISSSHAVAKGVVTNSTQLHVCYCHTPIRYVWDLYHQYLKEANLNKGVKGSFAKLVLHYIRIWDYTTSNRVDYFIANSNHTARRIKKIYGRDARIIYPPVSVDRFELYTEKEDFYLTASRLVPYKKIDLIVEAFSRMPEKKLVVIGDGPDFDKIKSKAKRNIEILGYQPQDILKDSMQRARAFIFSAEEDFGIVPVEAQACGTPVIAYGKGGAIETVVPLNRRNRHKEEAPLSSPTGIFFYGQTPEALIEAIKLFEQNLDKFDYKSIRENSERFSKERFRKEFKEFVDAKIEEFFR